MPAPWLQPQQGTRTAGVRAAVVAVAVEAEAGAEAGAVPAVVRTVQGAVCVCLVCVCLCVGVPPRSAVAPRMYRTRPVLVLLPAI